MVAQKRSIGGSQQLMFLPDSRWVPPALSDLPDWSGAKRVALDVETRDPGLKEMGIGVRRGGKVIGVAFGIEDGPRHYLPVGHIEGNMDPAKVWEYVRHQCKHFKGEVVGAYLPYDLDYLMENGCTFPEVKAFRDVQVADPLINEMHDRYSLDHLCERWGVPKKDEQLLREAAAAFGINAKTDMHLLPAKYVGHYAEGDVDRPLRVLRKQEVEIDKQDLWQIFNLESEVLPVLVKMRRNGVRVDEDRLDQVADWALTEEADMLELVKRQTGVDIGVGNVMNADALAPALLDIGVSLMSTGSGSVSVTKDYLEGIDHPVAQALFRARQVNKLRGTFVESVRRHMINGRIHCTFNQLRREKDNGDLAGAGPGRLSSETPNMQQQPARQDFAGRWRSIYLPEEGDLWAANDYSQQEPRMTIHYAEAMRLPKAREAGQQYRDDPNTDHHDMMTRLINGSDYLERAGKDEFKKARGAAKAIFLGLCYGMGGAKLCDELGLPTRWAVFGDYGTPAQYFEDYEDAMRARPTVENGRVFEVAGEEGQRLLDKFDSELPFVKKLAKKCSKVAAKRGYITTILGRRCRFPEKRDGSFDWTHKALNRLIQGSSADQTKKALVEADKAGFKLLLQVHDELAFSVKDRAEGEAAAEIMRTCVPLKVPSKVDVEIGPSWGEAK